MKIGNYSATVASQLPAMLPAREIIGAMLAASEPAPGPSLKGGEIPGAGRSLNSRGNAEELRARFTQFVGETFFGQMIKSMRAMTDKPAYFHGGRAEEVFQGQFDQKLAEHLTEASADKFAEPMFERQFPQFSLRNQLSDSGGLTELRRF